MDGFLLVIRCEVDDVPVGLFESKQDAISFAKSITRTQFSKIAGTAGFPEDAAPIGETPIHVVQFKSHKPIASQQFEDAFPKPLSRQIADTVKPLIDMAIGKIDCDDKATALLLAVADAVQDSSAEVGEGASDEADDIRRLVESWRRRRVTL
ncbi:MAG: hypothetical protein LW698_10340 [Planctomycetaceae bacterium]|jgi:hypothetical protein|nr:hypothetical protein [Planctomycetaceae bacterium]